MRRELQYIFIICLIMLSVLFTNSINYELTESIDEQNVVITELRNEVIELRNHITITQDQFIELRDTIPQ